MSIGVYEGWYTAPQSMLLSPPTPFHSFPNPIHYQIVAGDSSSSPSLHSPLFLPSYLPTMLSLILVMGPLLAGSGALAVPIQRQVGSADLTVVKVRLYFLAPFYSYLFIARPPSPSVSSTVTGPPWPIKHQPSTFRHPVQRGPAYCDADRVSSQPLPKRSNRDSTPKRSKSLPLRISTKQDLMDKQCWTKSRKDFPPPSFSRSSSWRWRMCGLRC